MSKLKERKPRQAEPEPQTAALSQAQIAQRRTYAIGLGVVLLIALGLRLWGIGWGLPDGMHYFSFHTDETLMVTTSSPDFGGLNLLAGKFLPGYYHYGSLPFYLNNLAISFASAYHLIGPLLSHGRIDITALAHAYLAARLISVILGTGTVWAVYAFARRLWTPAVGLLAALILAIMPLHAQHSHYATVDIGATFWQMLSLVWAAKVVKPDEAVVKQTTGSPYVLNKKWQLGPARSVILAGVFAGLTAATKYSGVLVILAVAAALFVRVRARNLDVARAASLFALAAICAALAFVVACPGCVLDTQRFVGDVQAESLHVMHQGEIYFQDTGPGWFYIVSRNLDAGMGWPLLALSLAGVVYAVMRREPGDGLLAAFALPTYLLIGAAQSRYARYEIPLLPILAIWSARIVVELPRILPGAAGVNGDQEAKRLNRYKMAAVLAGALVVLVTFADCVLLLFPMSQTDPRERAAIWIDQHSTPATQIGLSGSPWFWSPTLNPYFAWYPVDGWKGWSADTGARYCYNPNLWLDPATLSFCNAPIVALSEFQYYDPLRLHQPLAQQYVTELQKSYNGPLVFADVHPLGGRRSIDGLPVQDLPADMLYPSPTILVYTHR